MNLLFFQIGKGSGQFGAQALFVAGFALNLEHPNRLVQSINLMLKISVSRTNSYILVDAPIIVFILLLGSMSSFKAPSWSLRNGKLGGVTTGAVVV
jgi:hypothetical protein